MKIDHTHYHYSMGDEEFKTIVSMLTAIRREVADLKRAVTAQGERMAKELEDLEAEVARNTTVDESAITLLNGLATKIEEMKNDPVKLAALAAELRSKNDALADAVTRNTPAEPSA